MPLTSHVVLTPEQAKIERTLQQYVDGALEHEFAKFQKSPTAGNYLACKQAMLVKQAWWQRKSVSLRDKYPDWLTFMGEQKQGSMDEFIIQHAFGKSLREAMEF
jgi:hypothetical protein